MKRLAFSILSLVVGTVLFAPLSYGGNINQPAGKYERRYWDPSAERSSTEEKSFQHKSPSQREQQEGMSAPGKDININQPAGKYDRRYWDPTHK